MTFALHVLRLGLPRQLLQNHVMLIYLFTGSTNHFSGRWPLAGFCVTFCPLFLQLLLLQTCIDWPPAPPPPCPLLVSPDHLPCLRLLNSIFHRKDKRHLFPTRGGREREREDIRHQASGVPVAQKQLAPKWTDDGSPPLSILISIDFYFLPHLLDVIQDAVGQNARFNPITFPLAQVGQWRLHSKSNKAARWHVIFPGLQYIQEGQSYGCPTKVNGIDFLEECILNTIKNHFKFHIKPQILTMYTWHNFARLWIFTRWQVLVNQPIWVQNYKFQTKPWYSTGFSICFSANA